MSEVGNQKARPTFLRTVLKKTPPQQPLFGAQGGRVRLLKSDQLCSERPGRDGPGMILLFNEITRPLFVRQRNPAASDDRAEASCTDMRAVPHREAVFAYVACVVVFSVALTSD